MTAQRLATIKTTSIPTLQTHQLTLTRTKLSRWPDHPPACRRYIASPQHMCASEWHHCTQAEARDTEGRRVTRDQRGTVVVRGQPPDLHLPFWQQHPGDYPRILRCHNLFIRKWLSVVVCNTDRTIPAWNSVQRRRTPACNDKRARLTCQQLI